MNKFIFALILSGLFPLLSCNNAGDKNSNEKMGTETDDNSVEKVEDIDDGLDDRNTEIEGMNTELSGKVDDFLKERKLRLEQKIRFYDFESIERNLPRRDLLRPKASDEKLPTLSEVSYESAKNDFDGYRDEVEKLDFLEKKFATTYATKGFQVEYRRKNIPRKNYKKIDEGRGTIEARSFKNPEIRRVKRIEAQVFRGEQRPLPPDHSRITQAQLDNIYNIHINEEVIDAVSSIQEIGRAHV